MKLPKTMIMLSGMYEAPHIHVLSQGAINCVIGVDNIIQVLALGDSGKGYIGTCIIF